MLKIGARLPRRFDDAGEYLADARALDAAGVDSLWLDDAGCEPWLLLAWMAAVTGRVRLVVPIDSRDVGEPASLRTHVETLSHLSHGRVVLTVGIDAVAGQLVEAVIEIAQRARCCALLPASTDRGWLAAARQGDGLVVLDESPEALQTIAHAVGHRRKPDGLAGDFELWAAMKMPEGREGWRTARVAYEAAGATGVILPADPRLLDLLRNGDEDGDRSDLGLAQG
jgi:hypothetical protein